jgi:hypothetical protein
VGRVSPSYSRRCRDIVVSCERSSADRKGKPYAQRAQAETVNSMMKRNLGDALRAKTPEGRRNEQMLRVLTHNLSLLLARDDEG